MELQLAVRGHAVPPCRSPKPVEITGFRHLCRLLPAGETNPWSARAIRSRKCTAMATGTPIQTLA